MRRQSPPGPFTIQFALSELRKMIDYRSGADIVARELERVESDFWCCIVRFENYLKVDQVDSVGFKRRKYCRKEGHSTLMVLPNCRPHAMIPSAHQCIGTCPFDFNLSYSLEVLMIMIIDRT